MTEEVVISEGCRMVDGVDEVGGALLVRRRLGHLCGGVHRLTGDDHGYLLSRFSFTDAVLYL